MRKWIFLFISLVLLVAGVYVVFHFYSFIFAKRVNGRVLAVERVTQASAILGGRSDVPESQMYSFAVAIQVGSKEIFTGSTEDRQWAVVQKGQCAEAKFFPYPPWHLEKAGTYFGVRLIRQYDCP